MGAGGAEQHAPLGVDEPGDPDADRLEGEAPGLGLGVEIGDDAEDRVCIAVPEPRFVGACIVVRTSPVGRDEAAGQGGAPDVHSDQHARR